jgi:hypothetical protein
MPFRRLSPVLAILLAGLVYGVLPRGVWGDYDVIVRAAICGVTAALASLLLIAVNRWPRRFSL